MLKYECDECGNEIEKDETILCADCVTKRDTQIAELENDKTDLNDEIDGIQGELDNAKVEYEKQIAELQGEVAELRKGVKL